MRASVMGSTAHVVVVGEPDLERWAVERLRALEAKWSRFDPTSELSRVNAAPGAVVDVSPETVAVIDRAVGAWRWTGGIFDPTIHRSLCALGYDRSFDDVAAIGPEVDPPAPAEGCWDVEVDPVASTVRISGRTSLDLGGIGKGYAADLVLSELIARGADGACVNVGGDVAVGGRPPGCDGWIIGLDDPFRRGAEVLQLRLIEGAVATSSRLRRRWTRGGMPLHHIVDPRTGTIPVTAHAAVTVIAGSAAEAEVLAKTIMIDPDAGRRLLVEAEASAVVFDERRQVRCVGDVESFVA
jgi:thiamine biosynthesis lipoprotein